jgi:uncharacterized protein (TIGR03905 family)
MSQHFSSRNEGTCSSQVDFDIEAGEVHSVSFKGGCSGNLQGISRLVEGMALAEAIGRLEGIRCGDNPTSCPDQLAKALRKVQAQR